VPTPKMWGTEERTRDNSKKKHNGELLWFSVKARQKTRPLKIDLPPKRLRESFIMILGSESRREWPWSFLLTLNKRKRKANSTRRGEGHGGKKRAANLKGGP